MLRIYKGKTSLQIDREPESAYAWWSINPILTKTSMCRSTPHIIVRTMQASKQHLHADSP